MWGQPRYPWVSVKQRVSVGGADVPLGQCSLYKCRSRCGMPGAAADRVVTPRTHPTIHPTLLGADKVVTPLPPLAHPTFSVGSANTLPQHEVFTSLYICQRFMICKVEPNIVNIGSKWNAAVKWQRRCKIAASDC